MSPAELTFEGAILRAEESHAAAIVAAREGEKKTLIAAWKICDEATDHRDWKVREEAVAAYLVACAAAHAAREVAVAAAAASRDEAVAVAVAIDEETP